MTFHVSRFTHHPSPVTRHSSSAFSLVEILVTVALLSFIILGLFAMFNQTQRAFMTGMGQTDVLEAARAVTDMMAREFEQIAPSNTNAPTFYARINNNFTPLTQNLPGTVTPAAARTNYLQDIFILTRQNQSWVGIGYCVRLADPMGMLHPAQIDSAHAGVGSLYRFSETIPVLAPYPAGGVSPYGYVYPVPGLPTDPTSLWTHFTNLCLWANSQVGDPRSLGLSNRICDGVINLNLRAFATNGYPIYSDGVHTNAFFLVRTNGPNFGYGFLQQAAAHYTATYPDNLDLLYTWSNAVPAYLELNLGILEPRTYARYDSIPAPAPKITYVQRDDITSHVQLFRQRIPIRNVDPLAYQ